ncbi:unnamed protein product [Pedinophyceae sp. YPF-701]|nr:unnamed protein product [Pedinophyceae sp. YPF-701]
MSPISKASEAVRKVGFALAAAAALNLPLSALPPAMMPQADAALSAGVTNAKAILRNALPIKNKPIRQIQYELESISEALRIPGSKSIGPIRKSVNKVETILKKQRKEIEASLADRDAGLAAIAALEASLKEFDGVIEREDKQEVPIAQQKCLASVGDIEQAMVAGFPYEVPSDYDNLPQLKGRAEMEMKVKFKTPRRDATTGGTMKIVVDGYSAPVSAGAFVDLVARKFYDGMEIQRADGFVVQWGDPDGPAEGFVEPESKEIRRVPFELLIRGEKTPTYELTLEDLGRADGRTEPVLPFSAYGTLAMARAEFDNNSASSQVFALLKESELTPTGANLLDGRYAVFGYIVENSDMLVDTKVGDLIENITITSGLENLINSAVTKKAAAAPAPAPAPEPAPEPEAAPAEAAPAEAAPAEAEPAPAAE